MKKIFGWLIVISIAVLAVFYLRNSSIKLDEEAYLKLYENLIDTEISNSKIDFSQKEFIAVDTDSFLIVSEKNKKELINYLAKYDKDILLGSYNILNNSAFSDDGYLKGVLITASDKSFKYNTVKVNVGICTSAVGCNGNGFNATYNGKDWKVKEVSSFAS